MEAVMLDTLEVRCAAELSRQWHFYTSRLAWAVEEEIKLLFILQLSLNIGVWQREHGSFRQIMYAHVLVFYVFTVRDFFISPFVGCLFKQSEFLRAT